MNTRFQSSRSFGLSASDELSNESTEQTVKDLNLEEMFEVFEEADKTIPSADRKVNSSSKKSSSSSFSPSAQVGSSAPLGFFDPASFTLDVSEDQYKLYQEAEIKHGRVSMLAFVGLVVGEIFHPFFNGEITGPAIYHFQQADAMFPLFWLTVLTGIAMVEGQTIISAWQPLEETLREPLGAAKLKKTHTPGDLGFDPLGFKPKDTVALNTLKTKEINNGRLAMIGVAGIVAQELVTNSPIF